MSTVWYCATCGYEVDRGGRCHNCKEPLVESPLAELVDGETDDEVGYRLTDWDDSQRGELIEALIDGDIRHRFEADELVVGADDEPAVDALVANANGDMTDHVDVDDGEADEATVEALESVLHAARRLQADPTDMVADGELAEAGAQVFAIDHVYGIDSEAWASIGRVTRRLLAALGAELAMEDEISTQAAVLCRLLEPIVSPQVGDATPWSVTPASPIGAMGAPKYQPPPRAGTDTVADGDPATDLADGDEAADRHEVVYDLDDWLPEERAQLSLLLDREGVVHLWEANDLVVADVEWDRVDALCSEITRPGTGEVGELADLDASDDDGYQSLSELFGAADRLANDPVDKAKSKALVEAAAFVPDGSVPIGMSDSQWWQIRTRARALTDSLETGAGPDVIRDSAGTLANLLRGFV
jgi:hypothetical protein